jgi:hypothetical protein
VRVGERFEQVAGLVSRGAHAFSFNLHTCVYTQ